MLFNVTYKTVRQTTFTSLYRKVHLHPYVVRLGLGWSRNVSIRAPAAPSFFSRLTGWSPSSFRSSHSAYFAWI